MINEDTVFILGAGASVPYGYPTGKGLRYYICEEFSRKLKEGSLKTLVSKAEELSNAFKKSSTPSIDLFLNRRKNFLAIGKLSIILSILDFETKSKFREDTNKESNAPDQDWYSYIYQSDQRQIKLPVDDN
jgi:hypothetical protein